MKIIGISISGKDIYTIVLNIDQGIKVEHNKFELNNDSGESLRGLFNYFEIFLKSNEEIDLIILETAQPIPQRCPSFERIKAEGIIEIVIYDLNLTHKLEKIKTQKNRKHYHELTKTTKWEEYKRKKYFGKLEQIYAYLMLEGKL